ncbi:hypothetical protein L2E65_15265 [Planktothrix agardhii 1801]|jgi:hypothetical protein|uniref:hypothetical protein n=1 Tax=Planktothrix agardhii TaxID=1160 RepID=UPI001F2F7DF9|nr:hypothetical protein [Planktothrix agardhii]MCF3626143.1 hypothetical protein [Planktothrix agardhii 1801]
MNEVHFYPEICQKFSRYLVSYLASESEIHFSYNKLLPQMIIEIEDKFNQRSCSQIYIPKLKLDILFGIKAKNSDKINYLLLEVKYLKQLGLAEYSQLVGYLQVAENIRLGILLLVIKEDTVLGLSNDFHEIIRTQNLPMDWTIVIKNSLQINHNFKTGICCYTPNNGFEWIDVRDIYGISNFEELAENLVS